MSNLFETQISKKDKIISFIGESWYSKIGHLFDTLYMNTLMLFLKKRRKEVKVFPSSHNVFRAFKLTNYESIKVVIIGQDPYHNGQADGLAFSCGGMETPQSLRIIFSELHRTHKEFNNNRLADLSDWAKQGVLLLNTILTVDEGNPDSHKYVGWEEFTVDVLKIINNHPNKLVFVFWGSKAKQYKGLIDKSKHLVLEGVHPAAELHGSFNFTGNNHFLLIDQFLQDNYNYKINW